jgi:hypothetical protein
MQLWERKKDVRVLNYLLTTQMWHLYVWVSFMKEIDESYFPNSPMIILVWEKMWVYKTSTTYMNVAIVWISHMLQSSINLSFETNPRPCNFVRRCERSFYSLHKCGILMGLICLEDWSILFSKPIQDHEILASITYVVYCMFVRRRERSRV